MTSRKFFFNLTHLFIFNFRLIFCNIFNREKNIVFCSLLMAELGAHNVAYCFPQVKVITTAIDQRLDEQFHILPGLGNFGDRFFGTD